MYCTVDNLVSRFSLEELVQLTDKSGSGVVNTQVVETAINDASDLIDGYIGGRYTLPLSTVPKVLIGICASLARYNLYDNAVSDVVEKNHKAAIDFLTNVGKGHIRLGLSDTNEQADSDAVIEMQSAGNVFARAKSTGFI
jgi:phage gp36-like protein